ncbi:MAG TPA: NAD(P)/FAD-dependent oxidoreductase [Candidatus Eremiobacteraceae bacterium]|nr:NAD(P)/FAD-dependent oxidoreductase [Candidatus Eremiobacteraceae bacterium]
MERGARDAQAVNGAQPYDAIVVGAGHNGLVAAAYLARAGLRVCVVERSEVIGGATISEAVWPGWTVSAASYVCSLLDTRIVDELDLPSHGYLVYRKSAASFTPLPDGRSLLLTRDEAENAREIAKFSRRDVDGHACFAEEVARLGAALNATFEADTPRLDVFDAQARATFDGSAAEFVERYVETPVLQAEMVNDGLIGTYAGPRTPGTGYVLVHHNAGQALGVQGAWGFVRGGMGAVARAIAGAARAAGVEIRPASPVTQILCEGGEARGVVLTDGTEIRARAVLSNADPKTTFLRLVPEKELGAVFVQRVRDWRCIGVSLKVNFALGELPNYTARPGTNAQPHHGATIHVATDIDYLQTAYEDAVAGSASRRPLIECYMQSPSDPTVAPPGKHLLSVFAQYFPYDRHDGPWTDAMREAAADTIVAELAKVAPNIPNVIEGRQILAPPDLERRFGLGGGHIFHGELLPGQIFEDRFATRTPLRGLYLCGSGAHPGGCVTGVPGLRAARAAIAELAATR